MKQYLPGMLRTIILAVILLLIPVAYLSTTLYLEPTLKNYVRTNLPEGVKTRNITFELLPLSLNLEDATIDTGPEKSLSVKNIEVNPNMRSLLSDTFVIDNIELEGISLSFYQSDESDTSALEESGMESLFASGGPSANFRINQLILSSAKIQLFESPESQSPLLNFSPINLRVGPITPASLRNGLVIDGVSGFQSVRERIFFQGKLKVSPEFSLTGELRLDKLDPEFIPSEFLPGTRLNGGRFRGSFKFAYEEGRLNLSSANVSLKNSTIDFPSSSGLAETPTPTDQETSPADNQSWISIDEIQLDFSDIRVDLTSLIPQTTPTPLIINEGLIKAGPYTTTGTPTPIVGQLILQEPVGLFEFRTDLNTNKDPYQFENFLSDIRIDNVNRINPYLGTFLPVKLRSGVMTGAMKGSFTSSNMDLAVELDFNRLKLGSANTRNATFMGVPVKIYLNYLQKNDGNLELSFRMNGPPSSPNLEIRSIRNRILVNLGVDAAVLSTVGLPVYLSDKIIGKVTGVSIINEAKNTFSNVFMAPKSANDPPKLKKEPRKTPLPSPKR
ncbi:MAG: hypothetical protein ABEK50_07875 [bacterium]